MSELVQHGVHPPFAGLDVAEDSHVALAVDVDAERVLVLAVARVEIAAGQDRAHVQAEPVVGADREILEVGVGKERIELDGTARRRILEERIVEMPRRQLAG